jgi:NhaP-type Na+/H+ or K+/H+ antiporter
MHEIIPVQLASFLILGIGAQWLAWRLRLPAILLLLFAGFAAGPLMQWLGYPKLVDPDALFGKLLVPIVSLSVAVVLFEGGLSLNFSELAQAGGVIRNLVSIGAVVSWIVCAIAAHGILGMAWPLAILIGAVLLVTGPTVIGPLLRHVRPIGQAGPILKWEGIVIDPIGAMLTVLVFEAISQESVKEATESIVLGMLKIVLVGGVVGAAAARVLTVGFRRFLVPDYLQNPITLTLVIAAFTAANLITPESGLIAVTTMGILLGNQQQVAVAHIAEFKENLAVLLISGLFILLASRLTIDQIQSTGPRAVAFTLVLIFVGRPLCVALSTIRSGLSWRERLFLAWMAPRGIVAASVAALFALRLREANYPGSETLVPVTFTVIVGTVMVYGLTASWLSRWLQLSSPNPGVLIAGANPVAREIAAALRAADQSVMLIDSRFDLVHEARLAGLPVLFGSVLSQFVQEQIELTGIGRLLALTPNEEANSLAAMKFSRIFGRQQVFQLAPDRGEQGRKQKVAPELQGRALFGSGVTYEDLAARLDSGEVLKRTAFTDNFTYADFRALYGESALPLFRSGESGHLEPIVDGEELAPKSGQVLISLVKPIESSTAASSAPAS